MPDRETWRFINSFAPWLSALGTLTAVVVSLYFARRSERPRVRVRTGMRVILSEGQTLGQGIKVLEIAATNHGGRPVTIQGLIWRTGLIRKTEYIQLSPSNRWSARLPVKLEHGDHATFLFPLDELPAEDRLVAATVGRAFFPRLAVRYVRAGVVLTTGHVFRARIERGAQQWILDQVAKRAATATAG